MQLSISWGVFFVFLFCFFSTLIEVCQVLVLKRMSYQLWWENCAKLRRSHITKLYIPSLNCAFYINNVDTHLVQNKQKKKWETFKGCMYYRTYEGMSCKVWIVSVLVFSLIDEKCKLQHLKMNFCGENGW